MANLSEIFGSMVFGEQEMRSRLTEDVYESLRKTIDDGLRLDRRVADEVAAAMRDWAIEHGATHFTHWFQPMTGVTAEKHDSFISLASGGRVILEFSGKELIQGESDASSFPSGGLRATFEARGYTAWDPTSFAFIKGNTLCIPTAFCSYGGEALDKKTPLLRSMEALSRQAVRILRLFGSKATSVKATVGPEQEYFLVSEELFNKRPDLIFTGRTLFGAKAPKGQELDDHYYGSIKPSVLSFMADLDNELWKLGIPAKTEHNEAAPSQHELAPIYASCNVATDHNQLTMDMMKSVAKRHGKVCLLHEKPFEGVNGSGKHNNWSMVTSDGVNLFEPGDTPHENAQFLLFLCAVIKAVDDYQDILRISVASAGNDHRLGGFEAPPAIVSIFLGDELTAILDSIETGADYDARHKTTMRVGVDVLPHFTKDTTDRNRTSPFAFTGNKFEFRMPGSQLSISGPNIMINTAVAESLSQFADALEKADHFEDALHDLIKDCIHNHKRIIFNGNGYDEAWLREAAERGLMNLGSTPACVPYYMQEKNVALFTKHRVFTEAEMRSRCEVKLHKYCMVLNIEALTMLQMAQRDILPAVSKFAGDISTAAMSKMMFSQSCSCTYENETVTRISQLSDQVHFAIRSLGGALDDAASRSDVYEQSMFYADTVIPIMKGLRAACDELEMLTDTKYWPYPTYSQLLFGRE